MQRRTLVENKWVTFVEDKFDLPNGTECSYYHAMKPDAVMSIALQQSESGWHTYIVNQTRHPIGQTIWQFPIGGFDSSGDDPAACARKELQEETGVVAGSFDSLGSFYADPGFSNQKIHVFGTKDIIDVGEQQLEASEHDLVVKKVPVSSIGDMIESSEMGDAWGLAAFYYLNKYLYK